MADDEKGFPVRHEAADGTLIAIRRATMERVTDGVNGGLELRFLDVFTLRDGERLVYERSFPTPDDGDIYTIEAR